MSSFGRMPAAARRAGPGMEGDDYKVSPMTIDDEEPEVVFMGKNLSNGRRRRARGPRKNQKQKADPGSSATTAPFKVHGDADDFDDEADEVQEVLASTNIKLEPTVVLSDSDEYEEDDMGGAISTDSDEPGHRYERKVHPVHSLSAESDDPMIVDDEVTDITPPEVLQANVEQLANERKKAGNDFFSRGEYHKALEMYSSAIDALPTEAAFYGNRSACYMMLKKYKNAQSDARQAIQIDPMFEKGYLRLLRAALALGDVVATEGVLQAIKSVEGLKMCSTLDEETKLCALKNMLMECSIARDRKDFRRLLFLAERAMTIAEGDVNLKMVKADALLKLNRFNDALELCTEVLQVDNMCVEAYYVRSVCLFEGDNIEKSMQFLKQALQLAPDNGNCLGFFRKLKKLKETRDEASGLFSGGKYRDSKVKYTECLELLKTFDFRNVTIESKMLMNLSLIALKLGEADEALVLVNKAIDLNSSYLKAILHRAQVHNVKELFDEAVKDYETAQKIDPRNANTYRKSIQEAKMAAKRAKRKDYYKILGVDKQATGDDVKKAYKKRALIHHPDRHAGATDVMKLEQEKQFKEVGEAYEVLSDPKKRNRYDAGHDLLDDSAGSSGYGYEQFDSSNLFNVFFGAGGMGGGCPNQRSSAGGGYPHFKTHHGNYHPY